MGILDVGHIVLLAVIFIMVIESIITKFLNKTERSEMSKQLMARTLTEYTQSTVDLAKAERGELSDEEERELVNDFHRRDRVTV